MELLFGNKLGRKKKTLPSLYIQALLQHKTYMLNRSDILDIGNKNIVSYRIEFMAAIHSPILTSIDHFFANPGLQKCKQKYYFDSTIGKYKVDFHPLRESKIYQYVHVIGSTRRTHPSLFDRL